MTREYKQHQGFPLSLPSSILERATDLASRQGLSLNHFIGLAVAEKISRLDQGEVWTTTQQLSHLVSSVPRPKSTDATDPQEKPQLTARERQVLHLLADGRSNYELATELNVSKHTIKNHLFKIYDKLGVSSRMEAILSALPPHNTPLVPVRAVVETASSQDPDD